MTKVTTDQEIDLEALPWPASQRPTGSGFEVECHDPSVSKADVQAAVDAAGPPPEPPPSLADRLADVEERLNNAPSAADLDELKARLGGNR